MDGGCCVSGNGGGGASSNAADGTGKSSQVTHRSTACRSCVMLERSETHRRETRDLQQNCEWSGDGGRVWGHVQPQERPHCSCPRILDFRLFHGRSQDLRALGIRFHRRTRCPEPRACCFLCSCCSFNFMYRKKKKKPSLLSLSPSLLSSSLSHACLILLPSFTCLSHLVVLFHMSVSSCKASWHVLHIQNEHLLVVFMATFFAAKVLKCSSKWHYRGVPLTVLWSFFKSSWCRIWVRHLFLLIQDLTIFHVAEEEAMPTPLSVSCA